MCFLVCVPIKCGSTFIGNLCIVVPKIRFLECYLSRSGVFDWPQVLISPTQLLITSLRVFIFLFFYFFEYYVHANYATGVQNKLPVAVFVDETHQFCASIFDLSETPLMHFFKTKVCRWASGNHVFCCVPAWNLNANLYCLEKRSRKEMMMN